MLQIWISSYVLELLLLTVLWRFRRWLAFVLAPYIVLATCLLAFEISGGWGIALLLISTYRVGNLLRVIKNRMHQNYMHRVVARTSLWIAGTIAGLYVLSVIPLVLGNQLTIKLLFLCQAIVAGIVMLITFKNISKLSFVLPERYLVDRELPTVTVAIPARNETTDLQECLDAALASDYPKLEVIVLDDCSHDATAEIIKSYAHAGVRFVQGVAPADRWLAKNQAYEKLYKESSGDLVLFCGVDVRLGRRAIRNMVNVMHDRNKSMLSVLPLRDRSTPASAFMQPMRYWWELALPRRLFNRPPVLSTCWLIRRKRLKQLGGFAAVSHSILPEGFFARELVKTDEYSFIRSSRELDVRTVKSLSAQRSTAIRTLYPKIRRRPENALLLTIINLVFLIGPFISLLVSVSMGSKYSVLAVIACASLIMTHVAIVHATDPANSFEALFTFPIAVIVETIAGYASMIGYEFKTITWKDRNVCIPVMHTIPKEQFLSSASVSDSPKTT